MRLLALAVAALLALVPAPLSAQSFCAWHDNPGGGHNFSNGFELEDTDCFSISPLSVVWLESDGCVCRVDARIVGRFTACAGAGPGTCDNYTYTLSIAAGHSGGLMGQTYQGETSGRLPFVFYTETEVVACGSPFIFEMASQCYCIDTDARINQTSIVTSASGAPMALTQAVGATTCSNGATNSAWVAWCLEDCNPLDPPPDVPIE